MLNSGIRKPRELVIQGAAILLLLEGESEDGTRLGKRAELKDREGDAEEGDAHTPSSVSFRIGGLASVSLGFRAGCGWVFEGGGVVCGALQIPQLKWSEAD